MIVTLISMVDLPTLCEPQFPNLKMGTSVFHGIVVATEIMKCFVHIIFNPCLFLLLLILIKEKEEIVGTAS